MKTIIVPKNPIAQDKLNYNHAKDNELITLLLNDDVFYMLFESGFFSSVNKIAGCNIDDFEDDEINDDENLRRVLESEIFDVCGDEKLISIVSEIKTLFEEALKRRTRVYFYF